MTIFGIIEIKTVISPNPTEIFYSNFKDFLYFIDYYKVIEDWKLKLHRFQNLHFPE